MQIWCQSFAGCLNPEALSMVADLALRMVEHSYKASMRVATATLVQKVTSAMDSDTVRPLELIRETVSAGKNIFMVWEDLCAIHGTAPFTWHS